MAKAPFHEMVNRVGGFKDHRIDLMDIDGSQMGDEERLALAYWRFSSWQWDEIAGPKPEGFDRMRPYPTNFIQRKFFAKKFRKHYVEVKCEIIENLLGKEKLYEYLHKFQTR